MDYQEYLNRVNRGTQLFEMGNYQAALQIFETLVLSDISDIDKSRMCINTAVIYEKLELVPQALQWYDRGIELEKPHCRFEAQEYKAVYLKEVGRQRESLRIYESLLATPHLTEEDKLRMRNNVQELYKELSKPVYRRPGAPD